MDSKILNSLKKVINETINKNYKKSQRKSVRERYKGISKGFNKIMDIMEKEELQEALQNLYYMAVELGYKDTATAISYAEDTLMSEVETT